jgi:hypothetical protein
MDEGPSPRATKNAVAVSPRKFLVLIGSVSLALVVINLATGFLSFLEIDNPLLSQVRSSVVRLVSADGESNIPSWYSAFLLLLSAVLLATIASAFKRNGERGARWLALSIVFLYLSLDEAAQLHEMLSKPMRALLGGTDGFFYYAWVIPYGILLVVAIASFWRFFIALPRKTRRGFLLSAVLYVMGAFGMEIISGYPASRSGVHTPLYLVLTTIEEALEMAGLVLFVYTLLVFFAHRFGSLILNVQDRA